MKHISTCRSVKNLSLKVLSAKVLILLALLLSGTNASSQSFVEEFDNDVPPGWDTINRSGPVKGPVSWFPGNDANTFSQHSGTDFIAVNYNSVSNVGTISNWLIAPSVFLNNGDQIIFYTRTTDSLGTVYPDRLQLLLSTNAGSSDVGTTSTSTGDFTTLLLDINPSQVTNGYPRVWKKYSVTLSGISGSNVNGRFAFRYFLTNGGINGANGDLIGIDSVAYIGILSGMKEQQGPLVFNVYPTPSTGKITVQLASDFGKEDAFISVSDMLGRVFLEKKAVSTNEIDLSGFDKGMYFVTVKDTNSSGSRRIIIQ